MGKTWEMMSCLYILTVWYCDKYLEYLFITPLEMKIIHAIWDTLFEIIKPHTRIKCLNKDSHEGFIVTQLKLYPFINNPFFVKKYKSNGDIRL